MNLVLAMDFPPGIHALLLVHQIGSRIAASGPYQFTELDDSGQAVQE